VLLLAIAAGLATLIDALLLERKRGLFRGGFLAAEYLASTWEKLLFVVVSVTTDLALVAPLALATLEIARRARSGVAAARFLALVVALSPVVCADFMIYQLTAFLGQALDLPLMYELVGSKVSEFLAVSTGYLWRPGAVAVVGLIVIVLVAWVLHRLAPMPEARLRRTRAPRNKVFLSGTALLTCLVLMTLSRLGSPQIETAMENKASGLLFGLLVTRLTDLDGDGYGLLQHPPDPAPLDASIHPYAVEVPGNGIDENGVGGDLPLDDAIYREGSPMSPSWRERPDIVLFFLESVRAEAVGSYVGGRPVTPTMDRLAAQGLSVRQAYSHNGFTYQSRFHLFSGSIANLRRGTTLIDDFKANGYQVGYVSGQDDSFGDREFSVGCERAELFYDARREPGRRYTEFATPGSVGISVDVVQEQAIRFLEHADGRPLCLYVNFYDTHFPYRHDGIVPLVSDVSLVSSGRISRASAAEIVSERRDELRAMYLNTLANVDRALGEVLDAVTRRRGREPAVIVTSDHGESLFEEGFLGHGYALNDAQTRVPFLVAGLPLKLPEPLGHADVRDALWEALTNRSAQDAPEVIASTNHWLFQYIGRLERPRQVGARTSDRLVVYDFRTNRTLETTRGLGDGVVSAQGGLTASSTRLIHYWEAMLVARRKTAH